MAVGTSKNQVTLEIDKETVVRLERALRDYARRVDTKSAEKMIDEALRYSARPWENEFNKGVMYKYVEWRTGGSEKPMSNRKIKGTRKKIYGRKVGPKKRGNNSGWRAHFFARPARHISRKKRVPFYQIFAKKTDEVIRRANQSLSDLFQTLATQSFKNAKKTNKK